MVISQLESTFGPTSKLNFGSIGVLSACKLAEIEIVRIYTTTAHVFLYKA